MSCGLAKKIEISKVEVIILRFSPRNSYYAYDQHALNNQKNFKIGQKKSCVRCLRDPYLRFKKDFKKFYVYKFLWWFNPLPDGPLAPPLTDGPRSNWT